MHHLWKLGGVNTSWGRYPGLLRRRYGIDGIVLLCWSQRFLSWMNIMTQGNNSEIYVDKTLDCIGLFCPMPIFNATGCNCGT